MFHLSPSPAKIEASSSVWSVTSVPKADLRRIKGEAALRAR